MKLFIYGEILVGCVNIEQFIENPYKIETQLKDIYIEKIVSFQKFIKNSTNIKGFDFIYIYIYIYIYQVFVKRVPNWEIAKFN